jgi:predicted DNA-binding transcriptional regulator YafY
MKRSRISRVLQILTTLQAGKSYTVSDLSKMFRTSRRTIFRDLKELQAIGVPYRYDARTSGYMIEPEFFLPPIDLSLQEAMSLLLLLYKVSDQVQFPYKNSTLLAALKIENNLPTKIRQYCNTALRNISIRGGAQTLFQQSAGLDKTFAQLQQAIVKKRKVNIRYHSFSEETIIDVELRPYHLLYNNQDNNQRYNNQAWYVLGRSNLHKSVRSFMLNRIRELKPTKRCFVDGENFDLHDYLGKAWSMIPEGQLYNIKLKFLPEVAHDVAEIQWHSTQRVTFEEDDSAIVEFRVEGLNEITWWILSYGDKVQVLAPKILRQRIIKIAQRMRSAHQQEPLNSS